MDTHIYALRSWTIKTQGGEFYIAATGQERKHRWWGPYRTLQRATTAIARRLQAEFARRHGRVVQP